MADVMHCTICSEETIEPLAVVTASLRGGEGDIWIFDQIKCLQYWVNDELPAFFKSSGIDTGNDGPTEDLTDA